MHPLWRPEARIAIEDVYPQLDGGRYPVKRIEGELFEVWADLFRDGHDQLRGVVKYRHEDGAWRETPLNFFDNDRWVARFRLDRVGLWRYTIEAWTDRFESWREEVEKKLEAGQDVSPRDSTRAGRSSKRHWSAPGPVTRRRSGRPCAALMRADTGGRAELLLSPQLRGRWSAPPRARASCAIPASWRWSSTARPRALPHGTRCSRAARGASPARAPPLTIASRGCRKSPRWGSTPSIWCRSIRSAGSTARARTTAPCAQPGDPGSPYAIGSPEGGHRAVEPELGTLADFRRFVRAAAAEGIEVALDFAVQCAPDHPWVREHPQWFRFRPDGTIKYAENPPKKYEDIVNVDFDNPDRDALWAELRDVVLFWVGEGVRTFRVDNPHTKPLPFWEWLIREVKARCPEAIFLAEAFTRPKMMRALAKVGFSQSYTYFTWRNTKAELTEYLTELIEYPASEYFRPNFFTNTPDILPVFLQEGGRPAFRIRLVLAATLSPAYGIYNGFELCENTPIPGREEYLHSEKYEYKVWDWDRPGNIKDDIRLAQPFSPRQSGAAGVRESALSRLRRPGHPGLRENLRATGPTP